MPNLPKAAPVAEAAQRSILFLLSNPATTANDNHHRLPAAFRAAGWRVATASHQSLRLNQGQLECAAGPLTQFGRFWLLGFGAAASFFDRMQLLLALPAERFVVSPAALLTLHGKFSHLEHSPATYVSADLEFLVRQISANEIWVVKPTAGSNADGVQFVHNPAQARSALKQLLTNDKFALLQRYCPEIAKGEQRILCAAGQVIGNYLRTAPEGHVTNLSRGAQASVAELADSQQRIASSIAQALLRQGVAYCAIDLAGDWLIETNIANPGGLGTLATLTGGDLGHHVAQKLEHYWGM